MQKPRSGFGHKIQGSVLNKNRKVQRIVVNDDNAIGVISQVIANPRLSTGNKPYERMETP